MNEYEMGEYYLIDTNIFLRAYSGSPSEFYYDSVSFLKLIDDLQIKAYTSRLVISEVVWTLQSFYSFDRKSISRIVGSILAISGLEIVDDSLTNLGVAIYGKYNVKYTDAMLSVSQMVLNDNSVIVSYDKDFDKIGVKRMTPNDILKNFKSTKKKRDERICLSTKFNTKKNSRSNSKSPGRCIQA